MTQIRIGDIVIHRPADPTKNGNGPYYVDDAERYGGDVAYVAVAWIASGISWRIGLPRAEVEIIGHHEVDRSDRRGHRFSPRVIKTMRPVMNQATERLYHLYPELKVQAGAPAWGTKAAL